jgi:hypothetical protein
MGALRAVLKNVEPTDIKVRPLIKIMILPSQFLIIIERISARHVIIIW